MQQSSIVANTVVVVAAARGLSSWLSSPIEKLAAPDIELSDLLFFEGCPIAAQRPVRAFEPASESKRRWLANSAAASLELRCTQSSARSLARLFAVCPLGVCTVRLCVCLRALVTKSLCV